LASVQHFSGDLVSEWKEAQSISTTPTRTFDRAEVPPRA
jgi:hypothetical protein